MMLTKKETLAFIVIVISTILLALYILYLNDLHQKNVKKLSEPPLIRCIYCKGTGERVEDTNNIWMKAKIQLYLNQHLNVDKCQKCVKIPEGNTYLYCDEAESMYRSFVTEYAHLGPKMEQVQCSKCMGMGVFTSRDNTGHYLTQEEYEENELKR